MTKDTSTKLLACANFLVATLDAGLAELRWTSPLHGRRKPNITQLRRMIARAKREERAR